MIIWNQWEFHYCNISKFNLVSCNCREEEKELERRIAQVAKAQAQSNKRGDTQQPSETPNIAPNNDSGYTIERQRKISKAMEIAETKSIGRNLKVLIW